MWTFLITENNATAIIALCAVVALFKYAKILRWFAHNPLRWVFGVIVLVLMYTPLWKMVVCYLLEDNKHKEWMRVRRKGIDESAKGKIHDSVVKAYQDLHPRWWQIYFKLNHWIYDRCVYITEQKFKWKGNRSDSFHYILCMRIKSAMYYPLTIVVEPYVSFHPELKDWETRAPPSITQTRGEEILSHFTPWERLQTFYGIRKLCIIPTLYPEEHINIETRVRAACKQTLDILPTE